MKIYSANALAKEAGATYRQVHYWTELGLLKPLAVEGAAVKGSGNRRLYDHTEVEVARGLSFFSRDFAEWGKDVRKAVTTSTAVLPHGFVLTFLKRRGA